MKIPKFNLCLLLEFRTFVNEKLADIQASEFIMVLGQAAKLNSNEYYPLVGLFCILRACLTSSHFSEDKLC